MEQDWERTFPFLEIDKNVASVLFQGILQKKNIKRVTGINEGCRTTNYIIETATHKRKYILKIFFSTEQNYKKEIKLLTKLREVHTIPVPKIYKVSSNESIHNKEYAIYEYIEGKTVGQAISEGYTLNEEFVRDVARNLAKIHSETFNRSGFLDENLKLKEELPPLILWYEQFMGDNSKNRLGKKVIDKINYIVKENKKILEELDEDIRLIHGDFQGTNILIRDSRLTGILDWEFAMAGHPLADIGQFFRYEEYISEGLVEAFEDEYNKNSSYKLINNWYKISKLRDLANLIQLLNVNENLPNKHANIKQIIVKILKQF